MRADRPNRCGAKQSGYGKTGLMVHRQIFMERKQTVNNLLWSSKVNHYKCLIAEHKSDTKQLFRIANHLLGRKKDSLLPSGTEINVSKIFGEFFIEKVAKIRDSIPPAHEILDLARPVS